MIELSDRELEAVIHYCDDMGVVLDYVVLQDVDVLITEETHRKAALTGMSVIDKRLEEWALARASEKFPLECFFRVKIDSRDISGSKTSFAEFWGSNDAFPKTTGHGGWTIPNADGYKTAFFNPPYGLRKPVKEALILFNNINNALLLPLCDENLEIYKWANDWSNYFDAGKEWWGTFYWTIYNKEKSLFVVIGGSTTD
jgi:hypothetical protein